jgi:hypothetical protein
VFRLSRREYIRSFRAVKRRTAVFATNRPRAWAVIRPAVIFIDRYYALQKATNPYLFAVIAVVIAALVFQRTLQPYIP